MKSELKFKTFRREYKTLIKNKIRANLDYSDRNILKSFGHMLNLLRIPVEFPKLSLMKV